MNTYIVATVVAAGVNGGPPQINLWAVRTSSRDKAAEMIRSTITGIEILNIAVSSLDDAGKNALNLPDDYMKAI
ncbi:hypothetical protein [Methylobacterium radiotolerans]|uniref:hypothetical protein n=1 Tax=Methylobacterium radiotolerans TaxID=31998 RepID=UPI000D5C8D06|nr:MULTISPECIES: hypothetical protein [Methylobacterium]MDE3748608.1 hypothetical protein [Methylobacterium radiotolerans]PVZ05016.1 hypothetical protein C7388_1058 [Methylobacterium organophilum]